MNIKKIFVVLLLLPIFLKAFEPIIIKDTLNREVKIDKKVDKIIALRTSLSFVTYLNSVSKVVAIEQKELEITNKKTYSFVNVNKIKDLPIIGQGGATTKINYEKILTLKPDVIFTIAQNKKEVDEISNKLNIPVVALSYGTNKVDFELINKSLQIVGKILDKEERAKKLINYIVELKKSFVEPKKQISSYVGALTYKGGQGLDSTHGDFIPFKFAKVKNIVSDVKIKGNFFINDEFILMNDPKTIFCDSGSFDVLSQKFKKNKNYYEKLEAFRNEQVYMMLANTYYYINIDQMLANSFFIAKILYPNVYKELNPIKKADEIFNMFVGQSMYNNLKDGMYGFNKILIRDDKLVLEEIKF